MMKKFGALYSMLAVAVLTVAPLAQEEGGEGGMPPMGRPAEMDQLSFLVGTWKADFQMKMAPDAEWATAPCTQVYEEILNGCAIRSHFSGTVMGMPFHGEWTMTYNRATGQWQSVWIDDMGANITYQSGGFNEDGQMVMLGEYIEAGQTALMRDIVTPKSDTEYGWEMLISNDGGETWWTQMKANYVKEG
ncbi:MAG TPA: DUF1579 family protein [candidate division Zixibacteria bacterium]|nr:DUF1579 family protein [candidate division Zixibacteria bacterium]